MKQDSEFVVHLGEVFRLFGDIHSKRMFGGYGIYHQDLMIGLVADDVLYLKTDSESAAEFEKAGAQPFEFVKNGKPMKMSYCSAPPEVFDDAEVARNWAAKAFDAALRSKRRSGKRAKAAGGKLEP